MSHAITENVTVTTYFELKYAPENLKLSEDAAQQYRIAIRQLDEFAEAPVTIASLNESLLTRFVKWVKSNGRAERTANNKRQAILTLWRHAAEKTDFVAAPPKIAKLEEPTRIVQAWDVADFGRILQAARFSRELPGWDWRHRTALLLTIYDTSHRIGAILKATKTALNIKKGTLLLRAEWTKQKADTIHQLHPETLAAFSRLPVSTYPLLFPWPLNRRAIWADLKAVLVAAGLPATRKDMFHKLRRTSFTYTYALLGEQAARDHAGHTSNVTASYLDKQLLAQLQPRPTAIDVLPRPKFN